MITAIKAKEITLKVWRYLRDHPEICRKNQLPKYLYKLVKNFHAECPLCEFFYFIKKGRIEGSCKPCPLKDCHYERSLFQKWACADVDNIETRQKAAAKIVEKVEAWRPE